MKWFAFFFLTIISIRSYSQQTVSGIVRDSLNGNYLPYVNIYNPNTDNGTTTNGSGQFTIGITGKNDTLTFSYIGYRKRRCL